MKSRNNPIFLEKVTIKETDNRAMSFDLTLTALSVSLLLCQSHCFNSNTGSLGKPIYCRIDEDTLFSAYDHLSKSPSFIWAFT